MAVKLKDYYDGECARLLAVMVQKTFPEFDADDYAQEVNQRVGTLELKDRVLVLAEGLRSRLPADYPTAIQILVASLGPELHEEKGMFTSSWHLMPVARFVEEYGIDNPEVSLDALEEITKRHTGEWALRPFLYRWHDLTMARVRTWATSDSLHVRRLASEGLRTRLPWAARYTPFIENPHPLIDVIDMLIEDPSPYVRTSVANNLNDISQHDPALALATARRWLKRSSSKETYWIVNKGLRTLVKAGNTEALGLLGAEADPNLIITRVHITPRNVILGDTLLIEADLLNSGDSEREVVVDYDIYFLKKDERARPTTFKLKRVILKPGETVHLEKKHPFRLIRTRTYYPGDHSLVVKANGAPSKPIAFTLSLSPSEGKQNPKVSD